MLVNETLDIASSATFMTFNSDMTSAVISEPGYMKTETISNLILSFFSNYSAKYPISLTYTIFKSLQLLVRLNKASYHDGDQLLSQSFFCQIKCRPFTPKVLINTKHLTFSPVLSQYYYVQFGRTMYASLLYVILIS